MSTTEAQQQAIGNGLTHNTQKLKRHSSGEHAVLQTKFGEVDSAEVRRRSTPALQSHHISLNPKHKTTVASKPTPPPHPSVSPELSKLINKYKSRASNSDVIVIDSRSKSVSHACSTTTSPVPHKSTKCPPKRPASPIPPPSAPAPDPPSQPSTILSNPPAPPPPTPTLPTPPPLMPSPPLQTTNHVKPKRIPARPAPPPPADKSSSKNKAASVHKPIEIVPSIGKATPVLKKVSVDSKIAPLLEQFEKACSNDKACLGAMSVTFFPTKPQSSAIPKSQSTDILSPEKTTFPKSQSSDLLSPTSTAIPTSQSTDLLKPQIPKSQSSSILQPQKSIIPKSRSFAALKSHKSSLPKKDSSTSKQVTPTSKQESSTSKQESSTSKQDTSTSKQESSTSKQHTKNWKHKNSKLQALFHKAERRNRKKTKKEKASAKQQQQAKHTEEEECPIDAIYAVVQKIHLDDSLTPQTADEGSQTPGCWDPHQDEGLLMVANKNPDSEDDDDNIRKASIDNSSKLSANRGDSRYKQSEEVYAVVQKKKSFQAKEEEILPPLPPRLYENVFDDPSITERGENDHDVERGANCDVRAQLQDSTDNTYAVMHNPHNLVNGDIGEEEELPPLPPRLYENIFDDPSIAEHCDELKNRERGGAQSVRPKETTKHDLNAQLQENMDNTYAVMHNPRSKSKGCKSAKCSEEEELPPLPPRLYENIFDDPNIMADKGDVTISSEQEELPPPLPPKLYVNIFDDPASVMEHSNGVKNDRETERGAAQTNKATNHDLKAQLQESADNTYAVMHNPRKGEFAKSSEQEDIYVVMNPHPAFIPLIKKHFKNPKSK